MPERNVVPPKVMEQIYEDHGKNFANWNQELQDLFDPTISARQLNPPLSGLIKNRKNTSMHYHWAKDVCGGTPDHTRVEEMRSIGWEFADTNDVDMANDFTVRNRRKGDQFSNEIRNGDLRLMKIDLKRWREKRKSENVSAYQMAYPQAFGATGRPMSSADGIAPGLRNTLVTNADQLKEFEGRFTPENTSVLKVPIPGQE
jgi:hypothetical protein